MSRRPRADSEEREPMPDIEKILRLVAEGVLTAEEADEILSATADGWRASSSPSDFPPSQPEPPSPQQATGPRHIRIEVTEGGKRVVNLRVPMNVVGWASSLV